MSDSVCPVLSRVFERITIAKRIYKLCKYKSTCDRKSCRYLEGFYYPIEIEESS